MRHRSVRRALVVALLGIGVGSLVGGALLWRSTVDALRPVPASFAAITAEVTRPEVVDRTGRPLNATYANDWNLYDAVRLHEMPEFLVQAFVAAEDGRFFQHGGADWLARFRALGQNVLALSTVSGASTITEQVVRMIHPRPRTVWSRWLEGWEAAELERAHGKLAVLEFYLNQVPYAANRRGVGQAAHFYFDRDLDTLSRPEMLALAVMVRAPSRLDPVRGDRAALARSMRRLAGRMADDGILTDRERNLLAKTGLDVRAPSLDVDARHFLGYLLAGPRDGVGPVSERLRTTLDASLQGQLQGLVDQRLAAVAPRDVTNAALVAADHQTGEVLAWVVGGIGEDAVPGRLIDAVVTPRQPGSALKPFLYALALTEGWTAATVIDDAPLTEMVGLGLHRYSNYSRTFYGPLTLREALGNSLNIPAVRAIQFTGSAAYLALLRDFGFDTLGHHPDFYGDGLALGNGEVTLLELVTGYAALANRGVYRPLAVRANDVGLLPRRRVVKAEVASLIGNILSDPTARRREFGAGSLLNLPVQTAVKTGTSSDYRDSWAVGFDDRFVVGVWMGNLDQTPMREVTGSTGPALVLRGAFDLLNRHRDTRPLWLSPRLVRWTICADTGIIASADARCPRRAEYFLSGTEPLEASLVAATSDTVERVVTAATDIRLRQPTPGLHMAYDPRLPADAQAFEFQLQGVAATDLVAWRIDGAAELQRDGGRYVRPLARGSLRVRATVRRDGDLVAQV
ncbi:MAG: transglycosylase domain-containing protein, partial [Gammaproteobacteria bacterium]